MKWGGEGSEKKGLRLLFTNYRTTARLNSHESHGIQFSWYTILVYLVAVCRGALYFRLALLKFKVDL